MNTSKYNDRIPFSKIMKAPHEINFVFILRAFVNGEDHGEDLAYKSFILIRVPIQFLKISFS